MGTSTTDCSINHSINNISTSTAATPSPWPGVKHRGWQLPTDCRAVIRTSPCWLTSRGHRLMQHRFLPPTTSSAASPSSTTVPDVNNTTNIIKTEQETRDSAGPCESCLVAKLESSWPVGFGQQGGFRCQHIASTRWVSRKQECNSFTLHS